MLYVKQDTPYLELHQQNLTWLVKFFYNLSNSFAGNHLDVLKLSLVFHSSSCEKYLILPDFHCVTSAHIQSFSGPYPVQMRENIDQKNSKYVLFLRSV